MRTLRKMLILVHKILKKRTPSKDQNIDQQVYTSEIHEDIEIHMYSNFNINPYNFDFFHDYIK